MKTVDFLNGYAGITTDLVKRKGGITEWKRKNPGLQTRLHGLSRGLNLVRQREE